MLTGSDLLTKVKELGDVSKSDLVRSCGYVSDKKDGGERLNFTAFYEALLEAKGVNLGVGGAGVFIRHALHAIPARGLDVGAVSASARILYDDDAAHDFVQDCDRGRARVRDRRHLRCSRVRKIRVARSQCVSSHVAAADILPAARAGPRPAALDRKSTRLNSSHSSVSRMPSSA